MPSSTITAMRSPARYGVIGCGEEFPLQFFDPSATELDGEASTARLDGARERGW